MNTREGRVFAALADPTRRRLVEHLAAGEARTATELAGLLPITRQGVSKHLAVLEDAGLVSFEQVGREKRYWFKPEPLEEPAEWIVAVTREWDRRLEKLRDYLLGQDESLSDDQG